jgi:hypothetical protein
MKKSNLVSIGLRARTARAIAVVLGGPSDAPVVLKKFEMALADPKIAATAQPYHEVMHLPWEKSQRAVLKSTRAIEIIARDSLGRLIAELKSTGFEVLGVGIVGAADKDLARIGSSHIRAHAAEGVLFRRVLDLAADECRVRRRTFADREFAELAAIEVAPAVKRKLNELGRSLPAPWRATEKEAAAAAWLVLHGRRR